MIIDKLAKMRYEQNKKLIKLSTLKKLIKRFKSNKINYKEYYKHILINNSHYWNFVNPYYCKPSFCTAENVLKFLVFKNLIKKQHYRIKEVDIIRKQNYNVYNYYLSKDLY